MKDICRFEQHITKTKRAGKYFMKSSIDIIQKVKENESILC